MSLAACGGGEPVTMVSAAAAESIARPIVAARVPVGMSALATRCIVATNVEEDRLIPLGDSGLTEAAVLEMAQEPGARDCLARLGIAGLAEDAGKS